MLFRSDLTYHILAFLQPKDGLSLAVTNKMCYAVYEQDSLWKHYLTVVFKSFCCSEKDITNMISFYYHALQFPSYKKLFEIFKKLSFDLIGNYRGKTVLPNGHYFRIIPIESSHMSIDTPIYSLILEEYDVKMTLQWFVRIYYNAASNSLGCSGLAKGTHTVRQFSTLTIEGNCTQLRRIDSLESVDDRIVQLYHLPTLLKPSDSFIGANISTVHSVPTSHHEINNNHLYSCQGLSTATYGSHGVELIYVHIVNSSSPSTAGGVPLDIHLPRVHGLKVTGDMNVCAGRNSFVVDITQSVDPSAAIAEFEARNFPVVSSDVDGHFGIVNLRTERLHKIVAWYKGRGQINRYPESPQYEWIGCHFILYDSNYDRNLSVPVIAPVMYSIIFDEMDITFHHMMDFRRPPNMTQRSHYPFPVKQQQCGGLDWSAVCDIGL